MIQSPPPPPSGVQHPYLHDISCNNGSALPQTMRSPGEREERNGVSTRLLGTLMSRLASVKGGPRVTLIGEQDGGFVRDGNYRKQGFRIILDKRRLVKV